MPQQCPRPVQSTRPNYLFDLEPRALSDRGFIFVGTHGFWRPWLSRWGPARAGGGRRAFDKKLLRAKSRASASSRGIRDVAM